MSDYPYSLGVTEYSEANHWIETRFGRASPSPSMGGSSNGRGVWRRCNGHFYFKRIEDAQACYDRWGDKDEAFPTAVFARVGREAEAKAYLLERFGRCATITRDGEWHGKKLLFHFSHPNHALEFKLRFW
jgi:hypothetical protein